MSDLLVLYICILHYLCFLFLLFFYFFILICLLFHLFIFLQLLFANWICQRKVFFVLELAISTWTCRGGKCLLYNVKVFNSSNRRRIPLVTVGRMQGFLSLGYVGYDE